jgi:GT2 family glycosyltransferase
VFEDRNKGGKLMPRNPLLSIVVTSHTAERLDDICGLFDSIKAQSYPSIETLFIAERSSSLVWAVRAYGKHIGLPNLRVLYSKKKLGLGGARNLGSREARGEIIAFVDDDVVLSRKWAQAMVDSYSDGNVIGVTGASLPMWMDDGLKWLPRELYWLISCSDWTGWDRVTEARSLWGGNMSLRREAFERAGSFLGILGGHAPMAEDLEFSLRVRAKTGKKLLFNPRVRVWHKVYGYRVGFRFLSWRAHHIGTSRCLLMTTYLKDYASFGLEGGVLRGLGKTALGLPLDFFGNPPVAWKRFCVVSTVVVFAGLGYLGGFFEREAREGIKKARW